MRTYGRVWPRDPVTGEIVPGSTGKWVEVSTDENGFDDMVWATTLIQCLLLNQGESPFYANYGIPAEQSVLQQLFPDFYVVQTQTQFAPYFASLIVAKQPGPTPTYRITLTTNQGFTITEQIAA